MKYLLDTNACVQCMCKKGNPLVRQWLAAHPPTDVVVCSIVGGELCVGAAKNPHSPSEQAKVDAFLAPYQSLPFEDAAARSYAELRADLEQRGMSIADLDLMIAALALVHGPTLVTNNTADFSRISGLTLEDWEVS